MKAGWMRHKKKVFKKWHVEERKKSVIIRSEKGLIPTSFCWGIPPPSSVVKKNKKGEVCKEVLIQLTKRRSCWIKGNNKVITIPFDYG